MKVSICIPTFNQSQFLKVAIESIIAQSRVPDEIIVSDDCSTDDTAGLLKDLSLCIPFLKVVSQKENLGIARNTDSCLRMATGEFIIRLDSDDLLLPDYVEKLSKCLQRFPKAGYAHAAVGLINQTGKRIGSRKLFRKSGFQDSETALKNAVYGCKVAANIIMFRKEALSAVNYVSNRPNYVEDYHLSCSLAAKGFGNVYLDEELSNYRLWTDTGKVRQKRKLMEIEGLTKVFHEVLEPAYKNRRWNSRVLKKRRNFFACRHSDCLSWNVYTKEEKAELRQALRHLSDARNAKFIGWMHLNRLGFFIGTCFSINQLLKSLVKATTLKFRTQ